MHVVYMGGKGTYYCFCLHHLHRHRKAPKGIICEAHNPHCFREFRTSTKRMHGPIPYIHYVLLYLSFTLHSIVDAKMCCSNYGQLRSTRDRISLPHGPGWNIHILPPNRTSVYQPMDRGIIADFRMPYRRLLLMRNASNIKMGKKQREAAVKFKPDMRGLYEGRDAYMLDVTELVKEA